MSDRPRCPRCDREEAVEHDWARHERQYRDRDCPAQAGNGECWCASLCWHGRHCNDTIDWRARALAAEAEVDRVRKAAVSRT